MEEYRIALIGILIEDFDSAGRVNDILHDYGPYVVGRMGIPYRDRGVHIVSVVLDAPQSQVSALAGKLGQAPGVSVRTMYSKAGGA